MKFVFECLIILLTVLCGKIMAATESSVYTISTTAKSRTYAETVQKVNTHESVETEALKNDFIDNGTLLINVTLSSNSTEEDDNEADDIHSSFNLAIIPAVAVLVFIVISCIKCCKWFRLYTRGSNKDENYYAVIVTDEDKDFGQIDILSESASTACYDTVSSYTSFLKRSGNDSTLNSIRTLRQEGNKNDQCVTSQSGDDIMFRMTRNDVKKNANMETENRYFNSCSTRKTDVAHCSSDTRTSSTSSAETVSEQLTDSPAIGRNNRFRVSFVTEKTPSKTPTSENKFSYNTAKSEKVIRSSLKKTSTRELKVQDASTQGGSAGKTAENVEMVDVGTQTNKSFRYSLRKSKGHVSDSDIDEKFLSKLNADMLTLQTGENQSLHNTVVKRNTDKHINAVMHVKHSSLSNEGNSEPQESCLMSEILKYPLDTNVEVIHNRSPSKETDEEFDDDVFVKEDGTLDTPHSDHEINTCVDNVLKSCSNAKLRSQGNLSGNFSENNVYSCAFCNLKVNQNDVEHFHNKAPAQVAKFETVIPKYCAKCELLHKDKCKDLCETEKKQTEKLLLERDYGFTPVYPLECNERPPSSLSLESSGYAELSSTDSSSSTH